MNEQGFVIFAEGEEYVKQAYLLSLSLIASNNHKPVSIVTNNKVKKSFEWVFDKILPIPWYKKSQTSLSVENRWKIFHITPYEETIVLDSDILVFENLDYAWNFFKNYNLYYPTKVFTYRKEELKSSFYRKAFVSNSLPNFYNCFHFFKKKNETHEFFKWVELITNNWELFYGHFCSDHYPKEPSMDLTTSIASKILDCNYEISNENQAVPEIVHMKPLSQNWLTATEMWQDRVGAYITSDLQLKVGNHRQDSVFHYTENSFCRDSLVQKYEQWVKQNVC